MKAQRQFLLLTTILMVSCGRGGGLRIGKTPSELPPGQAPIQSPQPDSCSEGLSAEIVPLSPLSDPISAGANVTWRLEAQGGCSTLYEPKFSDGSVTRFSEVLTFNRTYPVGEHREEIEVRGIDSQGVATTPVVRVSSPPFTVQASPSSSPSPGPSPSPSPNPSPSPSPTPSPTPPPPPPPPPPPADPVLFVTSEAFSGNLGGRAGADAHCQRLGERIPGRAGSRFSALLSTTGNPLTSHPSLRKRVVNTAGEVVADGGDVANGIQNAVRFDENARSINGSRDVWTGWIFPALDEAGLNCGNWTNGDLNAAVAGSSSARDGAWLLDEVMAPCSTLKRLYCISE